MSGFRSSREGWRSAKARSNGLLAGALILAAVFSGLAKPLVARDWTRNSAALEGQAASTALAAGAAEQVELEGDLTVFIEDRRDGSRELFFLDSGDKRYSLTGVTLPQGLQTGMRVRVKGALAGDAIALEPGTAGLAVLSGAGTAGAQAPLSASFGAQRTLVLLVNFVNNPTQPVTVAAMRSIVFTGATSASNFDLENSYGQTWLTGDVFGYYTVAFNLAASLCTVNDLSTVATQAQALAAAGGVNLANYDRFVYTFPNTASCGFWGLGTIGGIPSSAYINGDPQLQVVAHEMGHNFGLWHSHALDCHPAIIGSGCPSIDYGDTLDIMGYSSYHFNAYQKERLGWLAFGSSPPMTTVTSSGTYTIDTYETVGSSPKALKIPIGTTGTNYYVEARKAVGFDGAFASNGNVTNGVVIHQASLSDGNSSELLDMTPSDTSFDNAALDAGLSFTDSTHAITITAVSVAATSATVSVNLGGVTCVRANPTVSLSPSQGPAVAAGTAVSFTVTVTNRDNTGCAAAAFDLTNAVPAGWTGSLGSSSLTLSPGAAGSTTLQVTSPASAANGSYAVSATARNRAATSYTGTGSATYVVSNPVCALANPTVAVSPAVSPGVPAGTAVSFTLSVTSRDSASCPAAIFDLTDTVPAGWTASFAPTSLTLSPGGSGSSTLRVTSAATAANGSYGITATARNHAATGYTATASATYVVGTSGTVGTFSDDFNRADSTNLGASWTEVAGDLAVTSGTLTNVLGVVGNNIAVQSTLSGATQTVDADFTSVDNNLGPRFGLVLRYQDPGNYYLISRQTGGSSRLLISRFVNGVETILAAVGITNPARLVSFHMRGRITGSTLSLDFNGVNKINATDTTFPAGKAGVFIGNKSSTARQIADNFTATVQ